MARTGGVRPLRRAAEWEDRFWRALEGAVPEEVRSHLTNTRREILLAVREIIDDAASKNAGTAENRGPARKPAGTRKAV